MKHMKNINQIGRCLRLKRAMLLTSFGCASIITSALAQPLYSVTDLGTLPGTVASSATSLNDRGDVVGSCSSGGSFNGVGFVWRNGVMISTGKLPKGNYSDATAISLSGVVVGDGDIGDFRPQAWVRTSSGLIELAPNSGNSHAIAINNNGAIGGDYSKGLSGSMSSWKAAIWTPDPKDSRKYRATDLPIIVGLDPTFIGTGAFLAAFNQSGQAAGYADNEVIGQHACFWNNDAAHSIVDLGPFPGDWSSIGWGMNDLGQVAGESHPSFGSRPVVWNNDAAHTAIELPLLPGDNYGMASRINSLGQILGSSAASEPGTWNVGPTRLVLWRDGGVFELQTVLDPVTGAGWTITSFSAINNLGQIVGTGVHNGQSRAFLMTPLP
jgi:uncharacterized membrane protein